MKMILTDCFIVQQEIAFEEQLKFVNKLLKTGKVLPHMPPDCFLWTGTAEELSEFMKTNSPATDLTIPK